jgi:hypothetical protein
MRNSAKTRLSLYTLLALVVCLVATTIWPDFVWPKFDNFHEHESRLAIEKRAFVVIAAPPAVVLGRYRGGVYTDFAYGLLTDRSMGHYNPPPGVAAAEFLRVAVPFWLLVIAAIAEGPALLIRRARQRNQSASAS